MSRYIDLEKAIERLKASPAFSNFGTDGYFLLGVVEDLLNKQPTADAVEVVRCRDCKHLLVDDEGYSYCSDSCGLDGVDLSDYCSDGERREENEG